MQPTAIDPRYPIGKYEPQPFSEKQKNDWINEIRFLPRNLENAILNLDEAQLETPYREGGWTVKQVVHHVADSHINAYCRFKLALTEPVPTIRTYDEKLWAELKDVQNVPTNVSITLLHALHTRLTEMLTQVTDEEWNLRFFHPAHNKEMSIWHLLGMYAWHGRHHVAHIVTLREGKNW
jgi:hypothetical protein